jgi:hypothetical protein
MSVQWVSDGLNRFFKNIGFNFFYNTVQEVSEALVPLDRIYAAKKASKLLFFLPCNLRLLIAGKMSSAGKLILTNIKC